MEIGGNGSYIRKAKREYAKVWNQLDDVRDKLRRIIIRKCDYDVPKKFGGREHIKDRLEFQGYKFKPHFCGCGCMVLAPEGVLVGVTCWACETGNIHHEPCGGEEQSVDFKWLKEFLKTHEIPKWRVKINGV